MTQSIDPVRSASDAPQDERPVSAWSLIKPYWVSSEWKIAWGLLVTIIAINLCVVWINVKLNKWNAQFYNALQSKDVHDFPNLLMQFSALAFGFIILAVYGRYLRQMLGFRWRQWLTDRF
ncbi:SbmA/BacA-like family transporter, partial [Burkholderia cenocepacia]